MLAASQAHLFDLGNERSLSGFRIGRAAASHVTPFTGQTEEACLVHHSIHDPDADVYEAAVVNIEVARLRRALRTLPACHRLVVAHRFGLDGAERLSTRALAERLGLSAQAVADLERAALGRLRCDFGVEPAA